MQRRLRLEVDENFGAANLQLFSVASKTSASAKQSRYHHGFRQDANHFRFALKSETFAGSNTGREQARSVHTKAAALSNCGYSTSALGRLPSRRSHHSTRL